ncbi:MAG: hypothetical protein JWR80_2933 [Bradyrhizobium sp.]|nr:hypothetical protein [Bradyrhizobium sp.]
MDLYSYVGNDPIDLRDPSGRDPGDVYATVYDAAVAAAKQYTSQSSDEHREFGGHFYRVTGGVTYSAPWKGDSRSVRIPEWPCLFHTCIEDWHTHGFPDPGYDNENFSTGASSDISTANANGRPLWLFTPNRFLKRYDPRSKKVAVGKHKFSKGQEEDQTETSRQGSGRRSTDINIDTPRDTCRWVGNCNMVFPGKEGIR